MSAPTTVSSPTGSDAGTVRRLVARVVQKRGHDSVSDEVRQAADLSGGRLLREASGDDPAVAFMALSQNGTSLRAEILVEPDAAPQQATAWAAALLETLPQDREIHLWVIRAGGPVDDAALAHGFTLARELIQMRIPLPTREPSVTTRSFHPGVDDEAWLEVNNRAFAWHPDQSGWTLDDLRHRMEQGWFDAEGFRILEVDGRLAGFCWTKGHTWTEPPMGEIYVIAVDPDFAGRGFGRELTLAGLHHLHRAGFGTGMLYAESDNTRAVGLYTEMGFTVDHADRMYLRPARG